MSYGGTPAGQEMERPQVVEIGASLVAIVGVFGVGRVAYGVVMNLAQDDWSGGARAVFLVLNSIVLLFSAFILALGYQVRQGRMWAWIVSLVMMPLSILFGGLMLLITVAGKSVPWAGTGIVLAAAAAMLILTAPRTARDYFTRKMGQARPPAWAGVPGQPWMPGQPPAPGQPWMPGQPPAPGQPWVPGQPSAPGQPSGPTNPPA
ncbi:hypothetical protein ACIA5D_39875 [Actinoplanes sp. NPDC051513]|uniref:hypothetical protein n=1 Tax=Actinoplanes sp. NPDC051513 TaxID=3363908 RepID=UPI003790C58C